MTHGDAPRPQLKQNDTASDIMTDEVRQALAELRQAAHTTPPKKVIALLKKYGFTEDLERPGRRMFSHPLRSGAPVSVPTESPMLPTNVKRVANAIEEVMIDDT
jgi:hypothetical protein